MKSIYNKLNVVVTIGFVLGVLLSVFNLYNLPNKLEKASGKIDLTLIREISPVLNQTNIILGLTLSMGLGGIFMAIYLLNNIKVSEKIVYVEKSEAQKEELEQKDIKEQEAKLAKEVQNIQAGTKDLKNQKAKFERILSALCKKVEASQGIIYAVQHEKNKRFIELFASYAYTLPDSETLRYEFGEGLSGQVAKEGKKINVKDIPEGYITIISGLGAASPNHLSILPIKDNGIVAYVVEIASFKEISASDEDLIAKALKIETDSPVKAKQEDPSKKGTALKNKSK